MIRLIGFVCCVLAGVLMGLATTVSFEAFMSGQAALLFAYIGSAMLVPRKRD